MSNAELIEAIKAVQDSILILKKVGSPDDVKVAKAKLLILLAKL